MKVFYLILAVMFLLFAFVQLNDPDPVIWIMIYGLMAVVCILASFRHSSKAYRIGLVVLLLSFGGYALLFMDGLREWLAQDDQSVLFDDIAKMQHPYIEESREFLGLMICLMVLIAQLVQTRRRQTS